MTSSLINCKDIFTPAQPIITFNWTHEGGPRDRSKCLANHHVMINRNSLFKDDRKPKPEPRQIASLPSYRRRKEWPSPPFWAYAKRRGLSSTGIRVCARWNIGEIETAGERFFAGKTWQKHRADVRTTCTGITTSYVKDCFVDTILVTLVTYMKLTSKPNIYHSLLLFDLTISPDFCSNPNWRIDRHHHTLSPSELVAERPS